MVHSKTKLGKNLMKKGQLLFSIAFLLIGALQAKGQEKPNVLMIVLDDLNDFVGVMGGHPQADTPNIDRLANQGILFTNAHSNCPVCSPSRASFMTGVHPTTTGCWGFKHPQKNPVVVGSKTIAEYARENGYMTYYTGKILHHPDPEEAWDKKGIKKAHGPYPTNGKTIVPHPSCPEGMAHLGALDATFAPLSDIPTVAATDKTPETTGWFSYSWGQKPKPFRYKNDDDREKMVDEKSIDWMKKTMSWHEKQSGNNPFLFALGIMRPHTPLVVPKKYYDMFPLESIQLPTIKKKDKDDTPQLGSNSRGWQAYKGLVEGYSDPDEGMKRYTQAYLACVKFSDDIVGQALDIIDNSKYKDNTIVMLFSDHGYHLGEKDELWKYTHWEETTQVPFIVSDPRYAPNAGKRVDHPISLIDVFPTIADLCEMKGPTLKNKNGAEVDGHSLKPFLANPASGQWTGPEFAVTVTDSYKSKNPHQMHLSARSKQYRYIRYGDGAEELYDHSKDQHEWTNLANNPEYASVKAKMKEDLLAYVPKKIKQAQGASVKSAEKPNAETWKDTYFKKHPEADTNKDKKLSWPEYKAHKGK
ncbi:MAG: sulfatase [Planctomycetes bacterium]|nr:sulfatase [Planctomycetota bacterium]